MFDRIAHAVVQFAEGPAPVDRHIAVFIEPRQITIALGFLRAGHDGHRHQAEYQKQERQAWCRGGKCCFHVPDISKLNLTGQ